MRLASFAAGLVLAVCASSSFAATDTPADRGAHQTAVKKKVVQPIKPSWEQCFDMSINRGFNHDSDEWQQSIQDCLAGKIPL